MNLQADWRQKQPGKVVRGSGEFHRTQTRRVYLENDSAAVFAADLKGTSGFFNTSRFDKIRKCSEVTTEYTQKTPKCASDCFMRHLALLVLG